MNEFAFATALRQELKAIWSAGPKGDPLTSREAEFEKEFSRWFIELSARNSENPFFRDLFKLAPDDVMDPAGFLKKLQDPSNPEAAYGALRESWSLPERDPGATEPSAAVDPPAASLSATFKRLIAAGKQWLRKAIPGRFSVSGADRATQALVVRRLNRLIDSPKAILASLRVGFPPDESHKDLLENPQLSLPPFIRNRLILQALFPDHVVRVWETARMPLSLIYQWIHAHPQSALCLSGGGIRSATFGLGILHGLARHKLLDKFNYLSTVSGGGYIGSWLSAWTYHEGNFAEVVSKLDKRVSADPMNPETAQVTHLRQYSNYLTPKLGLTSADTWTLLGTYVRNLLLNWSIFMPALAALLMVPRFCIALLHHPVPPALGPWIAAIGFGCAVWSIVYAAFNRPSLKEAPETAAKCGQGGLARFLCFCLGPLYVSSVCFSALWVWLRVWYPSIEVPRAALFSWYLPGQPPPAWPFLLLGLGVHLVAWLIYTYRMRKGTTAEFFACVLTGAGSGLLLWLGAKLWYDTALSAPEVELYAALAAPYFLLASLLGLFLFVGIASRYTEDTDREWWARMAAWLLMVTAGWALFSSLVIFGPEWLLKLPRLLAGVGGVSGLITLILSHSGATAANKKEAASLPERAASPNLVLAIVAPVFVGLLIAAVSLATSWALSGVDPAQEFHGVSRVLATDIKDLPFLASRLKTHLTPVSEWIWNHFSASLQQQLADYQGAGQADASLRANLAAELNTLAQEDLVYSEKAFANVDLSPAAKTALDQELSGQRRTQRNCLLLQDAFPRELDLRRFDHLAITDQSSLSEVTGLCLVLGLISWVLSRMININKFSLHAVYRDRLIRAYLGASNPRRKPDRFSGFDPGDNVPLTWLKHKPFHMVNMTLNLVGGENLAWQQRKAESFTASPLHAGSNRLGYRKVGEYASGRSRAGTGANAKTEPKLAPAMPSANGQGQHKVKASEAGLTLGTAIAISGAAADPNMGYHSSPVLALIMTLFNVRLGAWFGNPGPPGNQSYRDRAPKGPFLHLAKEALGLTDDQEPYVYLSDGGHFENLGLYEMVLRRCHYIVVSDAGADPACALEDLGNAIRKIRIDLGISIKIDKFSIASRQCSESKYCATGVIKYSDVDGECAPDGTLIYIKPAIGGDEPMDVFNYKEKSLTFPHESTADQWFSESQFESYRALGMHILDRMCPGEPKGPDPLGDFLAQAMAYLSADSTGVGHISARPAAGVEPVDTAAFPNGRT